MTIHPSCVVLCKCESGFFNGPKAACEVTEEERNAAVEYNQIASTLLEKSLSKMEPSVATGEVQASTLKGMLQPELMDARKP